MTAERRTHAKVNLTLELLGRRPDGYHLLRSLVAFAEIGDTVRVSPSDRLACEIEGPFAPTLKGEENLVLDAARALGVSRARLSLTKALPVASGLGGGSGDAAAALRLLDGYFRLDTPPSTLAAHALRLGADVPACLLSRACWMEGIGERLTPIPDFPVLDAVLVHPAARCPTGPVFAASDIGAATSEPRIDSFDRASLETYLAGHPNDLQPAAARLVPEIGAALRLLSDQEGGRHARMSGSGATCFALFEDRHGAEAAAARMRASRPDWWIVATRLS